MGHHQQTSSVDFIWETASSAILHPLLLCKCFSLCQMLFQVQATGRNVPEWSRSSKCMVTCNKELPVTPVWALGQGSLSKLMFRSRLWQLHLLDMKAQLSGEKQRHLKTIHSLLNGKRLLVVSAKGTQAFSVQEINGMCWLFTSEGNLFFFSFLNCVAGMCEHSVFGFCRWIIEVNIEV